MTRILDHLERIATGTGSAMAFIAARPGWGKTCILRHLADSWRLGRVYAVDPEGEVGAGESISPATDWRRLGRGAIILIDEADRVQDLHSGGPWLRDLAAARRPHGVSVAMTARRPQDVARPVSSYADLYLLGPPPDEHAARWMEAVAGPEALAAARHCGRMEMALVDRG